MDVTRWPLHKIMALPDWCFGQRWWIGTYIGTETENPNYFMIEENLPDYFVVWQLLLTHQNDASASYVNLTVRLGQEVPTAQTIRTFDRLFKHICTPKQMYDFYIQRMNGLYLKDLRVGVESRGRSIIGAIKMLGGAATLENALAIQISSFPKEVPDWVVSGLAGVH